MANPTTTTLLNANDKVVGMSDDGRYVSFIETSGNNQSLYVLDVNSNQRTLIDTFNGSTSTTGIDGGTLSPNGEFIFYSKGLTDAIDGGGNGEVQFFEKDLQSDTPPIDVTPQLPQPGFPGIGLGLLPQAISNDGLTIVYTEDYVDHTDTNPAFNGVVVENIVSGSQQQFASRFFNTGVDARITAANLSEDGRYLSYDDANVFDVQDLQSHTAISKDFDLDGSVSNDGRYVVYSQFADANGQVDGEASPQLFVHDNASPSTPDQLIPTSALWSAGEPGTDFEAVSGDGRHVVFSVDAPGGDQASYYVEDLDSSAVQLLKANGPVDEKVFISDDGSRIIMGGGDGVTVTQFQPPTLIVNPITGDDLVNGTDSIIIVTGTSSAINQTVFLSVEGESGASHTATAVVQFNGTWSALLNFGPPQPDGDHFIDATVTDELTTTATHRFTVDATPPALTLSSIAGDNIVNAAEAPSIEIDGTAFDNSTNFTGKLVHLSIDHTAIGTAQVLADGDWSFQYNGEHLVDGQHEIEFNVADTAGNVKSSSIFFDVDQTPPKITITSIGGDNVVNTTEARAGAPVVGTSDAIGATVNVFIGETVVGSGVVQADGSWIANIHPSGESGRTGVTAEVADEAGNQSSAVQFGWFDSDIIRVSTKSDGSQGDIDGFPRFYNASLSGDGRYVVFEGNGGLVSGDATNYSDVYVKDVKTGVVTLITKPVNASSLDGYGDVPVISQDGGTVAYFGQTGGADHIFVADWVNGTVSSANTTSTGTLSNGDVADEQPGISADGRYVAFASDATNLATNATSGIFQVYRKDMNSGAIQLVSEVSGVAMAANSDGVSISADGRYVAFESEGSGSVNDPGRGGNAEDNEDVYVRDMVTGALTLVSVTPGGMAGNANSESPVISPDGHYVAFRSYATDLVNGVTSVDVQYYLRDLVKHTTTLLTVNPDGTPSDDEGFDAFPGFSFSADSSYLAFATYAPLLPEDPHLDDDVYILDLQTHALTLAVSERSGIDTIASTLGSLSADGSYVAFDSQSTGLVPGDTNNGGDIFLRQLQADAHLTLAPVTGDDHLAANEIGPAVPVSGTSDVVGGVVTVALDGEQVATATVQPDGSWQTTFDARGLSGETVAITATVHDAVGFAASDGAMLVVDITPPSLITVQTAAGIDLRWGTLYNELANSPIGAGGTAAQFTSVDSGHFNGQSAPIKFVVTGTGLTYSGNSPNIQLTGGTITGVQETDNSNNVLATFTGLSIDAVAFQSAMNAYIGGSGTALDAIFLAPTYLVTGGAGSDRLQGGNLDDTFSGSTGNDTIDGGAGSNTADYSALSTSGLVGIVQGGGGTINKGGSNGVDTLTGVQSLIGSTAGDVFYVDAGETVTGGGGFDYLIELTPNVTLSYGTDFTGITEFVSNVGTNSVNYAADTSFAYVYGSTGNDTLTLGSGGGYLFGEGGSNVLNGGANATNLFVGGGGGTDTMNGGTGTASNYYFVDGSDQVNGAGAFNVVIALSSDVNLQVGSGLYQDVQEFVSNGGNNSVTVAVGDADFKYLYGGTGNDTLTTGSGGGYLIGEGGTNTLTGGGGTNVFVADGSSGVDTMNGGSDSNIYFIDTNSHVQGAGTFNTVIELQQNVSLTLGSAQLGSDVQEVVLSGGTDTVDFHSATSAVFLYGSAGNDTLFGGTGNDFLYGGLGANTFEFGQSWGRDTIGDWTAGTGSLVDLTALASLGVHAVTDLTQTITSGNDTITSIHTGTNSITLLGVGSALTASSFHFA